jgi:hypothetical protein
MPASMRRSKDESSSVRNFIGEGETQVGGRRSKDESSSVGTSIDKKRGSTPWKEEQGWVQLRLKFHRRRRDPGWWKEEQGWIRLHRNFRWQKERLDPGEKRSKDEPSSVWTSIGEGETQVGGRRSKDESSSVGTPIDKKRGSTPWKEEQGWVQLRRNSHWQKERLDPMEWGTRMSPAPFEIPSAKARLRLVEGGARMSPAPSELPLTKREARLRWKEEQRWVQLRWNFHWQKERLDPGGMRRKDESSFIWNSIGEGETQVGGRRSKDESSFIWNSIGEGETHVGGRRSKDESSSVTPSDIKRGSTPWNEEQGWVQLRLKFHRRRRGQVVGRRSKDDCSSVWTPIDEKEGIKSWIRLVEGVAKWIQLHLNFCWHKEQKNQNWKGNVIGQIIHLILLFVFLQQEKIRYIWIQHSSSIGFGLLQSYRGRSRVRYKLHLT